ncbi:hypothetical protein BKP37_10685 [Anaerobacillus alkalilacustris]|uniref:Sirohydrochlorin chelatase n=1 Tax=Anaerobacillus alkalilacustris TaxID=393763 RepID=A0A1S2LLU5_9BACI|nr:sirohydrochlorin chelatase [Anaerobacillus alkalilacustris]OIJ13431.1 hypothetical protein BKP37_10685 [Anaerobacillus alkalilacustris]
MQAVLLVGHGSRNKFSNQQFIEFAKKVEVGCRALLFRYAFLELASPSIIEEIKCCVEKGAKEIIVYPLLLLSAGHAKYDIPDELVKAKQLFPEVDFQLEQPLGIQEVLLSILENRLKEQQYQKDDHSLVVFVGRGSNDQSAITDFETISGFLKDRLCTDSIEACFLVGGNTSFEAAIARAKQSNFDHIYVLPYFLFKGVLLKRIHQFVKSQQDERFTICEPIGTDEDIIHLVSDIIDNAVNKG